MATVHDFCPTPASQVSLWVGVGVEHMFVHVTYVY